MSTQQQVNLIFSMETTDWWY